MFYNGFLLEIERLNWAKNWEAALKYGFKVELTWTQSVVSNFVWFLNEMNKTRWIQQWLQMNPENHMK